MIDSLSAQAESMQSIYRISGLASGIDTDSLVQKLMKAERIPLDKLNQQRQILEWQKDDYRNITNLLRGFQDDFFDVLKSSSNMRSPSLYKQFTSTSTDTSFVTATATGGGSAGTHKISVTQFATQEKVVGSASVTKPLTGSAAADTNFINASGNYQFNINLDGITKTVNVPSKDYNATGTPDYASMVTDIQNSIDAAFGSSKITVSQSGGVIKFDAGNHKVILTSGPTNNDALSKLKFNTGVSNRINSSDTLETISGQLNTAFTFDTNNQLTFNINGTDITVNQTDTLSTLINKVNSSSAGVILAYDDTTDKFTITAKQEGTGNNVIVSDTTGNFFHAINIVDASNAIPTSLITQGKDAEFTLDGTALVRNSNTFTVNGITYSLTDNGKTTNVTTPQTATINIAQNTDGVFNAIKSWVDKYNDIIAQINDKLSEKRNRDYLPLTDDQKSSMNDTDIKNWEDKAKSGLLNNDSILQSIVYSMRRALSDPVNGDVLSNIGITTGSYEENGKLIIDETKLRNAIQNNPDQVQAIFSTQSSISYSPDLSSTDRGTRYNSEGIANRIYDILQDNIRITRNNNGQKGILLEKAGITGDITDTKNLIDKAITEKDQAISDMMAKLNDKENQYYQQFDAMEQYISQMNSQASWLSQQFGGR